MPRTKTVILANGSFPQSPAPLKCLQDADRVVCCDGAALSLLSFGRIPDAVIGDLDSMPAHLHDKLKDIIVHITEQDTNDLSKAFHFCLSRGWTNLTILGATGKREDHTLGNISLLADFAKLNPNVTMITDNGTFVPVQESKSLNTFKGQQISIFAMEQDTPVFSEGLKYPLNGLAPNKWWQATLNEAMGESFSLSFPAGRTLLIFFATM